MTKRLYDVVARVGKFKGRDGSEKTKYQQVGVMLQGERGPYLLLESWFNPAGAADPGRPCFLSLYEPGAEGQSPEGGTAAKAPALPDSDPEIPANVRY